MIQRLEVLFSPTAVKNILRRGRPKKGDSGKGTDEISLREVSESAVQLDDTVQWLSWRCDSALKCEWLNRVLLIKGF